MARIVENPRWTLILDGIVDETVVEDVAEAVREDMGRFAPMGATRRLKGSFIKVKPGPLRRWIGSTLWYWRFPHDGTGRHEIRAGVRARSARTRPHAKALRWPGMRVPFPKRKVDHPGSSADRFTLKALYQKRRIGRIDG